MNNRNLDALWNYHNTTKHSYQSIRTSAHYLDWTTYPFPFKIYTDLDPIPLPREWAGSDADALSAIASTGTAPTAGVAPDLRTLAALLFHSAGVTRHRTFPGGNIYFRAAACTGALYEVELYLVCGRLPELGEGVYHFNPGDFALRKLQEGDYRSVLANAAGNEPSIAGAPVTIVCTGIYWRNAWKYQARTYRHFFWDNGTMLANLLAMAAAFELPARLVMGFVDGEVNRLLGLDTEREVAISLAALGTGSAPLPPPEIAPLALNAAAPSKKEIDYPLMRSVHAATSLDSAEEVKAWRGQAPAARHADHSGRLFLLEPLPDERLPHPAIEQTILRRGSTRQFARLPIRLDQLATLLLRATQGIQADFLNPVGTRLNDLYLIVNAVEGLPAGAYFLRRDTWKLELLKEGDFREQAGHLGLDQQLPADASVAAFFLADLKPILERFGNRGYRAAQIEAGILGGKLYLAAYAQKLGATGLTFYDDEVTEFFSPHASGKSAIFLMALGVSARNPLRQVNP